MKFCHGFIIFCNICLNFGTGDVHKALPIGYEFHKNQHNESYNFYVLLTVHLSIFILVINQLDEQNFCFTISSFHSSTCFEHMCSKHVEA